MSEEIRDRLTRLETKHEERHKQTLDMLQGVGDTQKEIVKAVQDIAIGQSKMGHIGKVLDTHEEKIDGLEKAIEKHKAALGFIGAALTIVGGAFVSYLFGLIGK